MRPRIFAAFTLVFSLALTACGGSEGDAQPEVPATSASDAPEPEPEPEPAPETTPTPEAEPVVILTLPGTSTLDGETAGAGAELAAGAVIEVTTGPAALTFADGSVLRLDSGAKFTVGEGDDKGVLAEGLSWSRVAPSSRYVLTVGSARLAAEGTAFAAGCDSATCSLAVLEGAVEADGTQVAAGQLLELSGDAPAHITYDAIFGNEFVKAAADADAAEINGAPDANALAATLGPAFASWQGTYSGTSTVAECNGVCDTTTIGEVRDRTYTFEVDCAAGFPCSGIALSPYRDGEVELVAELPMSTDGQSLTYLLETSGAACDDGSGAFEASITWTWTPTEAAVVDGAYVVTAAEGVAAAITQVTDGGTCQTDFYNDNSGTLQASRD